MAGETTTETAELPIFPLSNVVLFPRVRVPLHVFEPRYRQMTREALAGDRRIGMVVVQPEHREAMEADPPLFPVGCEGHIEEEQKLPDGRYHIVLHGTTRFRVVEELPRDDSRLYRVARVAALADPLAEDEREPLKERRRVAVELLRQLMARSAPDQARAIQEEGFGDIDDETLVNALSQALDFPTRDKQALLEANGVSQRCEHLISLLRFQLAEQAARGPSDPSTLH